MAAGPMIGVEDSAEQVCAVLLEGGAVRGSAIVPTAGPDRLIDVLTALVRAAPAALDARGVAVATDAFETALATRAGLARVGCVRLAESADDVVPPLFGWPADLLTAVGRTHRVLTGGCTYDGTPRPGPSAGELDRLAADLGAAAVEAVAVTAAFAPVDAFAEQELGAALTARLPGLPVALSHSLGSIGLLERENSTALNATLLPLAASTTAALEGSVRQVLPGARPYLTRLDGTVMELPAARRFPALTLGAVAAARIRGVARLVGADETLVAGQSAGRRWLAVVHAGEPARTEHGQIVAGVRTSLAALHLVPVEDGPQAWTLAARAIGRADGPWVAAQPGAGFPVAACADIAQAVAVGAASTRIAGVVDWIVPGGPGRSGPAVEQAREQAAQQALLAGAAEGSIEVAAIEQTPLAYVPGDLVRLRVVAAGDLP